jgi:hypothetical protein
MFLIYKRKLLEGKEEEKKGKRDVKNEEEKGG